MPWVKIDDQFPDNQKIIGLSDQAFRLHVTALCYCSAQLTDGRVTALLTRRLTWFVADSNAVTNELVTAGLWHRDGDDFIIHDYLEYNPSAEKVKSDRKANAERQKRHRKGSNAVTYTVTNADYTPLVTTSPSPSPSDDNDWEQALADMQILGLWSKTDRDRFADMWPDLSGRRDWVGKAITLTRDKGIGAAIPYALKVLANAIHTGKEPGYVNGKGGTDATKPRQSHDNPEALERSRRIEECISELAAQGVTQDTDRMWMVKLDDLVEAKHGFRP